MFDTGTTPQLGLPRSCHS